MRVDLRGEPKSGTTWLETWLKALAMELCENHADSCKLTGNLQTFPKGDFTMNHTGTGEHVHVTAGQKHSLPCAPSSCSHPRSFATWPPCNASSIDLPSLEKCVRDCKLGPKAGRCRDVPSGRSNLQVIFVSILRDPRTVSISACHHLSNWHKSSLAECTAARHAATAAWLRFRELYFASVFRDGLYKGMSARTLEFSYESAVHCPHAIVSRLADVMGFQDVSSEAIDRIIALTSKDASLERKKGSKMLHAWTARSGKSDHTHHDFDLPGSLVAEMDSLYDDLQFPDPLRFCGNSSTSTLRRTTTGNEVAEKTSRRPLRGAKKKRRIRRRAFEK